MRHKILAYLRVSTDEQAAAVDGSLDNQRYRLNAYVDLKCTQEKNWGEIIEWYIDDGYSAKDTRRPAYQRMMTDLKKKKGNLILVTDLSRLSRNIFDFCNLMNSLESISAQFLSIKELFDSSTASGKMMIYNMINLAQFEREQVAERVSLGVHARAMRGLLNGGRPILGFDKDPNKPGTFIVNEKEAADVNRIFRIFLNSGSRAKTIKELELEGIKPKLAGKLGKLKISDKWSAQTLGNLLTSAAYIGMNEVNKSNKEKDQTVLKSHQQYKIVKASWPAIISEADFVNAGILLEQAKKLERARLDDKADRFYILSGVLRCGECGSPLVGQAAHGEKSIHRYYGHTKANAKTNCKIHRVIADVVEKGVLDYIWDSTRDAGYLHKIEQNIKQMRNVKSINVARDKKQAKDQLQGIQTRIDNLLLMQAQANNTESIKLILNTFEALSKDKQTLESRLQQLNYQPDGNELVTDSINAIEERLNEFKRGFPKASKGMKKRLLRSLLKQVILTPEGLTIFMPLADGFEIPNHQMQLVKVLGSNNVQNSEFSIIKKASGDASNLVVLSSDIGKVGDHGKD